MGDFLVDTDVIDDRYDDEEGLGNLDAEVDQSEVQLMLDSMATSSDTFFQELGSNETEIEERGTAWRHDDDNMCNVVLIDEVDRRNLDKAIHLSDLTITKAQSLLGIDRLPSINDCLELFLHRDWYFLLENIINSRMAPSEQKCTIPEVMQIMRMWILQMINKQTSTKLFKNDHRRWGLVDDLDIKESRYNKLIKAFKCTDNEKQINADSDVDIIVSY
jgi:hypothetical protein